MEDLMIHHDDQFGNKGTYEFAEKTIDVKIDGKIVSITVTQDGLLAASHIEGAGETNKIVRSLFDDEGVFIGGVLDISVRPDDRDAEKIYNVLKRLLDFQDVPIFREG